MVPQTKKHTVSIAGFILAFMGAVLFSTKAIIVKIAFRDAHTDALTLLTIRMLCSLPFYIAAVFFANNKKDNTRLTVRQWSLILVLGLFGYYLSSLLDFMGLQYISAGLERLILFLYPSFVVLINAVVFKEKINGIQKLALALTYAGIAFAYYGELQIDSSNPDFFTGSLLIFCCAITYAVYIVGSGKMIPVVGATKFTAYTMLAATVGILVHFTFRGSQQALLADTGFWRYGILLAIVATVIPSFLISNALKKIGANNLAIIAGIGPVSTIIQAHFFLGEKIFAEQIAGTVLVIAGVLLIGWRSRDTGI